MTENHPINPPPQLVEEWYQEYDSFCPRPPLGVYIATKAAQWGADQELLAVEEEIIAQGWFANSVHRRAQLRNARRPKPPSLKEQALETLKYPKDLWSEAEVETIRRALEALPE